MNEEAIRKAVRRHVCCDSCLRYEAGYDLERAVIAVLDRVGQMESEAVGGPVSLVAKAIADQIRIDIADAMGIREGD